MPEAASALEPLIVAEKPRAETATAHILSHTHHPQRTLTDPHLFPFSP